GAGPVLRRHALLRGAGDPVGHPGAGALQHADPQGLRPPRPRRRPRLPRSRRRGVHPGPAASDDRPRGPPGAPADRRGEARRGRRPPRRCARLRFPPRPGPGLLRCLRRDPGRRPGPRRRGLRPRDRRRSPGPGPAASGAGRGGLHRPAHRRAGGAGRRRAGRPPPGTRGGTAVVTGVPAVPGPVLLVCHSTRPRGGLVHTLSLGEALLAAGVDVRLVALGDPAAGLFRPTALPHTIVAAPPPAETLEERVFQAVAALLHAQDCIAARAACRIRDGHALTGPRPQTVVVRTVHHVDDFTTRALIECQQRAVVDPDRVLVVSDHWRERLAAEYGVEATVVRNGVDPDRFGPGGPGERDVFRARAGAGPGTFLVLTVGGIEPRKGSVTLLEAMARLKAKAESNGAGLRPVLAVVGGHTFFDYRAYRDGALARLPELGLVEGRDILLLGTVSEADLGGWYRAADAFAFPSVKEGFGLVVLEALAAGLPVVASDIPVFAEYLEDGRSALLVPPGDAGALAGALDRLAGDRRLRRTLAAGGRPLLDRFTWAAAARATVDVYRSTHPFGDGTAREAAVGSLP